MFKEGRRCMCLGSVPATHLPSVHGLLVPFYLNSNQISLSSIIKYETRGLRTLLNLIRTLEFRLLKLDANYFC